MKTTKLVLLFMLKATFSFAQNATIYQIDRKEVERIETTLSSDKMQGRKVGTPGIEKAANFLAKEFQAAGLQTFQGAKDFFQRFTILKPIQLSLSGKIGKEVANANNVIAITSKQTLKVTEQSKFQTVFIKAGANFPTEVMRYAVPDRNYIVFIDTSFSKSFPRILSLKSQITKNNNSVLFVLSSNENADFQIQVTHKFSELSLSNIAGVLPGKSRKDEFIIFSAHYDHLGVGKPVNGDSIYNGANDDASGTTAVVALAKYFKGLKDNERTLVFVAFTAEESGGFGSQYFSKQLPPEKVFAMLNIEMIGTESKWGKGSAYITGYEKTNMGEILAQNLVGSTFRFYPDPYPEEDLFFRSDNTTLARLGVPAHTISTSKMDDEPNYHKVTDEIGTLDMENMTEIIKAIALSSHTIISGNDSPSRIDTKTLKR